MRALSPMARWALRLVLAAVAATGTWTAVVDGVDRLEIRTPPIQISALQALDSMLQAAADVPATELHVAFFGDSLAMPENIKFAERSTPWRLKARLQDLLGPAQPSPGPSLRMTPLFYSGLSQYSLYYMADRILDTAPDLVVIEFNLYNFSSFWEHRDRKILAAMLRPSRFPELLTLPTSAASQATDQWIYDRLLFQGGWTPVWAMVQREQARCSEGWWRLADHAQGLVGSDGLRLRPVNRTRAVQKSSMPGNRSSASYSRTLFGAALTGVREDHAALRVFGATLDRFHEAGIHTLVYVPPYNLQHLRSTGVLEGTRLEETVALVRMVTKRHGAAFLDLHALLPDEYFRDRMDHLHEARPTNGHDVVARRLAAELSEEAKRILAEHR